MRLNTNQQETLMYQSRLLFQHDEYELAHTVILATIYSGPDPRNINPSVFAS